MMFKEFLTIFFKEYELFDKDLNSEKYISKFFQKTKSLHEVIDRFIKNSNSDFERLIYVFYYMDDFFENFITELKSLGFNTSNLQKVNIKVLLPLARMKKDKLVNFERNDNLQKIITSNNLHNHIGKVNNKYFTKDDLEQIFDFFEFANLALNYFESFANGDMELKKVLEPKLTSKLYNIIIK